ncbi:MAG: hypothetical protein ACJ72N_03690 [Labedaea sp.]
MDEPNECADAAARYRRTYGWPCTAHGHAVWMLAGEAAEAVDVPVVLGPGLAAVLHEHGRPHPVIQVPDEPGYWRFLVEPGPAAPPALAGELTRHGARFLRHAALIELPPTRVRGGALRWVREPAGDLPAPAEVAGALITVVLGETTRSRTVPGRQQS